MAAPESTQAQKQAPAPNFIRRGREIPVRGGGRNPRLIPKRGKVLNNALRVIFSACLPCMKPTSDSRRSSRMFPS